MTDLKPRAPILPDPTPRERAHEAVDGRFEDIDTDLIARVRRPAEAPAAYLPYLAWERSVDVYDPAWPEDIKRAVIEAAPVVHRYKGTRFAVTAALAALRVDTEIVEWWQTAPRGAPYTFRVTAYARARLYDGPLLDARLVRAIYASVVAAKPESRAFDLSVAAGFPGTLGVGVALTGRQSVRVQARPAPPREDFPTTLGLAPAAAGRQAVRVLARPADPREEFPATLGLAPALIARQRVALAMIGTADE